MSSRQLQIEALQLQIMALRRRQFGRKSEKLDGQIDQLELKLEELQTDESQSLAPNAAESPQTPRIAHPTQTYPVASATVRACGRAAAMSSLICTAKLNNLNPEAYLQYVFAHIGEHPVNRVSDFLPWNLPTGAVDKLPSND